MELVEYAFETWSGDGMSRLYVGQDATDFIEQHHRSGTFATLHAGGKEILNKFIEYQNRLQREGYHGH
jgi:hypothetical protein